MNVKAPSVLPGFRSIFKYRTVQGKHHLDYLRFRHVYFSSFESNWHDDDQEGLFDIDLNGLDESTVLKGLLRHKQDISEEKIRERIEYFLNPSNHGEIKDYWRQIQRQYYQNSGVFCCSRSWDIEHNWMKFGDSHKGFVVEYDTISFPINRFDVKEVDYCQKKPSFLLSDFMSILEEGNPNSSLMSAYLELKYYKKPIEFMNEQEIRVSILAEKAQKRVYTVNSDDIVSVRIGKLASRQYVDKIREACFEGQISSCKIVQLM